MNEKSHELPKAQVGKSHLNWLLWLIPIAAALVCAWFVAQDIIFAGPTVTIYFENADGLQEQNSLVEYRGVKVGEVGTLKLRQRSAARRGQSAIGRFGREYRAARLGFWIVRPEVKLGSLSGLQTIVSGNYITVQPGNGARTNLFIGAETEPIKPVKRWTSSCSPPNSVHCSRNRRFSIGTFRLAKCWIAVSATTPAQSLIHARIREEYAPLVRMNSKFWNAGGIDFRLGLFSGAKLSAESAQTLISGGIAFATPPDFQKAATNGADFQPE